MRRCCQPTGHVLQHLGAGGGRDDLPKAVKAAAHACDRRLAHGGAAVRQAIQHEPQLLRQPRVVLRGRGLRILRIQAMRQGGLQLYPNLSLWPTAQSRTFKGTCCSATLQQWKGRGLLPR